MCVLWSFKKLCFLWFLEHRKKALTKVSHFFWVSIKERKRSTFIEGLCVSMQQWKLPRQSRWKMHLGLHAAPIAFDLLKVGGQNLENLAPAWPESVKLAIWLYYGDEECQIILWPKLTLPRPGAYTYSLFLCSVYCTWFLRGPNTRGNKCLSVKESGKQNNKGGKDLKKFFCCPTPNWEELGASSYSQLFLVHLALIRCRAGTQHPVALLWLGGVKFYKLADFFF